MGPAVLADPEGLADRAVPVVRMGRAGPVALVGPEARVVRAGLPARVVPVGLPARGPGVLAVTALAGLGPVVLEETGPAGPEVAVLAVAVPEAQVVAVPEAQEVLVAAVPEAREVLAAARVAREAPAVAGAAEVPKAVANPPPAELPRRCGWRLRHVTGPVGSRSGRCPWRTSWCSKSASRSG